MRNNSKFIEICKNLKLRNFRSTSSAFMLQLAQLDSPHISKSNFLKKLKKFNAKLEDSLVEQYVAACMVQVDGQKHLDVRQMANHYLNRHPHTTNKAFS